MSGPRIAEIRSFNRFFSQTIGALQDHYLGCNLAFGEARLIFEIGDAGADLASLRKLLRLDSGYLSRLLRSLERQGLVTTVQKEGDKRNRRAMLTRAGNAQLKALNRKSDQLAQSILNPLKEAQQTDLIEAMGKVQRLLAASAVAIDEESPSAPDAQYCLDAYFRELADRFDGGFDPADSQTPTSDEFASPSGTFLVVRLLGKPVGCGAFKRSAPRIAYLKRMWIAPHVRGLGLSKRLLRTLEDRAWSMGCRKAQLETNRALTEAAHLYESLGYKEIPAFNDEKYAHHWFEKPLRARKGSSDAC